MTAKTIFLTVALLCTTTDGLPNLHGWSHAKSLGEKHRSRHHVEHQVLCKIEGEVHPDEDYEGYYKCKYKDDHLLPEKIPCKENELFNTKYEKCLLPGEATVVSIITGSQCPKNASSIVKHPNNIPGHYMSCFGELLMEVYCDYNTYIDQKEAICHRTKTEVQRNQCKQQIQPGQCQYSNPQSIVYVGDKCDKCEHLCRESDHNTFILDILCEQAEKDEVATTVTSSTRSHATKTASTTITPGNVEGSTPTVVVASTDVGVNTIVTKVGGLVTTTINPQQPTADGTSTEAIHIPKLTKQEIAESTERSNATTALKYSVTMVTDENVTRTETAALLTQRTHVTSSKVPTSTTAKEVTVGENKIAIASNIEQEGTQKTSAESSFITTAQTATNSNTTYGRRTTATTESNRNWAETSTVAYEVAATVLPVKENETADSVAPLTKVTSETAELILKKATTSPAAITTTKSVPKSTTDIYINTTTVATQKAPITETYTEIERGGTFMTEAQVIEATAAAASVTTEISKEAAAKADKHLTEALTTSKSSSCTPLNCTAATTIQEASTDTMHRTTVAAAQREPPSAVTNAVNMQEIKVSYSENANTTTPSAEMTATVQPITAASEPTLKSEEVPAVTVMPEHPTTGSREKTDLQERTYTADDKTSKSVTSEDKLSSAIIVTNQKATIITGEPLNATTIPEKAVTTGSIVTTQAARELLEGSATFSTEQVLIRKQPIVTIATHELPSTTTITEIVKASETATAVAGTASESTTVSVEQPYLSIETNVPQSKQKEHGVVVDQTNKAIPSEVTETPTARSTIVEATATTLEVPKAANVAVTTEQIPGDTAIQKKSSAVSAERTVLPERSGVSQKDETTERFTEIAQTIKAVTSGMNAEIAATARPTLTTLKEPKMTTLSKKTTAAGTTMTAEKITAATAIQKEPSAASTERTGLLEQTGAPQTEETTDIFIEIEKTSKAVTFAPSAATTTIARATLATLEESKVTTPSEITTGGITVTIEEIPVVTATQEESGVVEQTVPRAKEIMAKSPGIELMSKTTVLATTTRETPKAITTTPAIKQGSTVVTTEEMEQKAWPRPKETSEGPVIIENQSEAVASENNLTLGATATTVNVTSIALQQPKERTVAEKATTVSIENTGLLNRTSVPDTKETTAGFETSKQLISEDATASASTAITIKAHTTVEEESKTITLTEEATHVVSAATSARTTVSTTIKEELPAVSKAQAAFTEKIDVPEFEEITEKLATEGLSNEKISDHMETSAAIIKTTAKATTVAEQTTAKPTVVITKIAQTTASKEEATVPSTEQAELSERTAVPEIKETTKRLPTEEATNKKRISEDKTTSTATAMVRKATAIALEESKAVTLAQETTAGSSTTVAELSQRMSVTEPHETTERFLTEEKSREDKATSITTGTTRREATTALEESKVTAIAEETAATESITKAEETTTAPAIQGGPKAVSAAKAELSERTSVPGLIVTTEGLVTEETSKTTISYNKTTSPQIPTERKADTLTLEKLKATTVAEEIEAAKSTVSVASAIQEASTTNSAEFDIELTTGRSLVTEETNKPVSSKDKVIFEATVTTEKASTNILEEAMATTVREAAEATESKTAEKMTEATLPLEEPRKDSTKLAFTENEITASPAVPTVKAPEIETTIFNSSTKNTNQATNPADQTDYTKTEKTTSFTLEESTNAGINATTALLNTTVTTTQPINIKHSTRTIEHTTPKETRATQTTSEIQNTTQSKANKYVNFVNIIRVISPKSMQTDVTWTAFLPQTEHHKMRKITMHESHYSGLSIEEVG